MHILHFYSEIFTKLNFLAEGFLNADSKENGSKSEQKTDSYYFEKKFVVFYKHKTVKLFQFLEKIHRFVGFALVTGTKLKLSFFSVPHLKILF